MHHRKTHSPHLAVGATTLDALMDTSVGPSTLMAVADLMTPKRKRSTTRRMAASPKRKTASPKRKTASPKRKTAAKGRKPCKAGKIRDRVTKRCRAPKK